MIVANANVRRTGPIAALTRAIVRRRKAVLFLWLALIPVVALLNSNFGSPYSDNLSVPGLESQDAIDLMKEHFPAGQNESGTATLVAQSIDGPITSAENLEALNSLLAQIQASPNVTGVISPAEAPGRISEDGTYAYATIQFAEQAKNLPKDDIQAIVGLVESANTDSLRLEVGGSVVSASQRTELSHLAEIIGLVAAMVILTLTFGALVPAIVPIATALVGLLIGLLSLGLVGSAIDLPKITPSFATMIGLGVGIDYALFVVMRYRESLHSGRSVEDAVVEAVDTAGRAVLAAGGVVVIALLGLNAVGIPFIGAMGIAAAVIVTLAIVVALTLLPALLAMLGHAIDRGSIHRKTPANSAQQHRGWPYRLSNQIQKHPVRWAIGALVLLVALTIPLKEIHLAISNDGYAPAGTPAREAYDMMAEGFGDGVNGPIAVALTDPSGAAFEAAELQTYISTIAETPGVASVSQPQISADGSVARFSILAETGPEDEATADLVSNLRSDVLPGLDAETGLSAQIGGQSVLASDISDRLVERMPLFFGLVLGLSFLLLMAVFRSLAVPIKAVIMNMLSIGAAYGVLVAVFQWGWGAELIGVDQTGPIEAFLPMILFAVLFGLSTDYEVFLLSRIRERYLEHKDNARAVSEGVASTATVITAAAAIMVTVFLAFLINDTWFIKQSALGLAIAVLIDATIVRLILVPATMEMLGDWNWWLPRFLDRILPRVNIEGDLAESPKTNSSDGLVVAGSAGHGE